MTQETIDFTGDPGTNGTAATGASPDFTITVGDRTYKSPDDVVKKISHADQHIETLLREKRELEEKARKLEEEAAKAQKLEEILERLQSQPQDNNNGATMPDVDTLVKQVTQQVENAFQRKQFEDDKRRNWDEVTTVLTRTFGKDKVNAAVKAVAEDSGMTLAEAAELARTKPKAFLRLFPEINKAKVGASSTGMGISRTPSNNGDPRPHQALASARTEKDRVNAFRDYAANIINKAGN